MMRRLLTICIFVFASACATTNQKKDPDSTNDPPPKMMSPLVKKIWVAPAIKNGGLEWESGHYLYRIERQPTWSR